MSQAVVDDVDELKRRLHEAEETLRAIREGEVDALIVRGMERDEVFHLVGGSEGYRAFMESMDMGAAALDEAHRLLYANAALAAMLGRSPDALQRDGLFEALGPTAAAKLGELLDRTDGGSQSAQLSIGSGNYERNLIVKVAVLPLSFSSGFALTFTDVTETVAAAVAEENERIGRAVMASANEAVVVCDVMGVISHANPAVLRLIDQSPVGRRFEDAFRLTFASGAGIMQADDLVAIALGGGSVRGIEAAVRAGAGEPRDVLISAAPLRQGGGAGGCIMTLVDLSERKVMEERQTLLMRELGHRMKNMLALVLSISTRTAATSTDLKDFKDRFSQRIAALAATQNLLAEKAFTSIALKDVAEAELAPYVPGISTRVKMDNLDIQVSRDAAVSLGLVLHELVTNAVKYGALSNDSGRLTIAATPAGNGLVELLWTEEGGPPISPPSRTGFGQTVIARGLGAAAAAPTTVDFRPEGVVCRMTLAAAAMV